MTTTTIYLHDKEMMNVIAEGFVQSERGKHYGLSVEDVTVLCKASKYDDGTVAFECAIQFEAAQ